MDIGIFQTIADRSRDPAVVAKRAEELGFESYWAGDHPIYPVDTTDTYPGAAPGTPAPDYVSRITDPLITLARISGATSTIKLGTSVCLVAERNPLLLAKQIATLDDASDGRFLFGVGAGWDRAECEILGGDFDHRWSQVRESISIMKDLWTKEHSAHHGRYYDFPAVRCFPKPARKPHPPILLGVFPSPRAFKRIADYADGWMPLVYTPADLAAGVDEIKRACDQKGRDFSTIDITVLGGEGQWRSAGEIAALARAGAKRVVLWLQSSDLKGVLAEVETLARQLRLERRAGT